MTEILTFETLMVNLLDFDIANKKISQMLAKNPDDKFYFKHQFCGLIDVNNRYFLIDRKCQIVTPQINDIKTPIILFELPVFQELSDAIQVKNKYTVPLKAENVEEIRTKNVISLRKFMEENFNSSLNINEAVTNVLQYVNGTNDEHKYQLI